MIVLGIRLCGGAGALVFSVVHTALYVLLAGVWRGYTGVRSADDS